MNVAKKLHEELSLRIFLLRTIAENDRLLYMAYSAKKNVKLVSREADRWEILAAFKENVGPEEFEENLDLMPPDVQIEERNAKKPYEQYVRFEALDQNSDAQYKVFGRIAPAEVGTVFPPIFSVGEDLTLEHLKELIGDMRIGIAKLVSATRIAVLVRQAPLRKHDREVLLQYVLLWESYLSPETDETKSRRDAKAAEFFRNSIVAVPV